MLKSLAVFCKLCTEHCNSSSEFDRITWPSTKSKMSNFKFLFMVILLCNVSHNFMIMFIYIITNRGDGLQTAESTFIQNCSSHIS
jgi:hypothetical protein